MKDSVRYYLSAEKKVKSSFPFCPGREAQHAMRFHKSIPAYQKTPLYSLSGLAEQLGVKGLYVKDEAPRFGLQAFKGLGGSYAMFRILCETFGMNPEQTALSDMIQEKNRTALSRLHFITCTDGNHGRGISWAAGLFGCQAHVYMPFGSQPVRAEAIRRAGPAEVVITDLNYDDTVAYASRLAAEKGWILIQDTSWEGYEKIPAWIMQGYLTLAAETADELSALGVQPTHLFLQAGVGAMAGAVLAYMADYYKEKKPVALIVEPEEADCLFRSAQAEDGKIRSVPGSPVTIMAGLNCGTPCSLAWPIIRDYAEGYLACSDSVAAQGMRAYAERLSGDARIISGESGAATLGALLSVIKETELSDFRKQLKLDRNSVILLINTEGATDPENYQRIVNKK